MEIMGSYLYIVQITILPLDIQKDKSDKWSVAKENVSNVPTHEHDSGLAHICFKKLTH